MTKRVSERQEKRENRRSILNRLRAVLQSFRGQHGEKMVCVRRVSVVTRTLGKANSHFDPTQTGSGRTTTLRRLLICTKAYPFAQ